MRFKQKARVLELIPKQQTKPILGEWLQNIRLFWKVIQSRIRIGHTNITLSFLLKIEDPSQKTYTVKHFLIDSIELAPTRQKYYQVNNRKDLFENTNIKRINKLFKKSNCTINYNFRSVYTFMHEHYTHNYLCHLTVTSILQNILKK